MRTFSICAAAFPEVPRISAESASCLLQLASVPRPHRTLLKRKCKKRFPPRCGVQPQRPPRSEPPSDGLRQAMGVNRAGPSTASSDSLHADYWLVGSLIARRVIMPMFSIRGASFPETPRELPHPKTRAKFQFRRTRQPEHQHRQKPYR